MSVRLRIVLSDDLNTAVERVARENGESVAYVFRKALTLFLAARDGSRRGLKVALVDSATHSLETEFSGF